MNRFALHLAHAAQKLKKAEDAGGDFYVYLTDDEREALIECMRLIKCWRGR